jgi:hypothetical protein
MDHKLARLLIAGIRRQRGSLDVPDVAGPAQAEQIDRRRVKAAAAAAEEDRTASLPERSASEANASQGATGCTGKCTVLEALHRGHRCRGSMWHLVDGLAGHDVPFANLRLLDRLTEEAIISEYGGAPTLVAALEPEALADRDVLFLCGSAEESAECLRWKRRPGAIVIDLSGAATSNQEIPLVALNVNSDILGSFPGSCRTPSDRARARA